MKPLKVCIDKPMPLIYSHQNMFNAIKANPLNNPAKAGTDEHRIIQKFVANPNQRFSSDEGALLTRMALITDNKWQSGATLNIGFLNGSDIQKRQTQKMAAEWLQYADIKFNYIDDPQQATIRIAFQFNGDQGSWSYIGTECLQISKDNPTMNFGWLEDDTADEEWRRVVVHEFGHALGCIHEHSSPGGNIQWNKPAVYQYYEGPPNNWTQQDVDNNVFFRYSTDITQFTTLDPNSIMMYPIPAQFTLNGFSVGMNTDLSDTDKSFIRQEYP
ncbi:MAG TPA: M12 family metallopeptidase [Mucilaginibacter sp.]|nr:M12 family metallopeptidase [Mucilaginibacter sp.]